MQPPPPPAPPYYGDRGGMAYSGPSEAASRASTQAQQRGENQAGPSSSSASPSSSSKPVPKVSCLECRASKVKCLPQTAQDPPGYPCARCNRLSKSCVYEKHKRGRKPDSVKYGKLEKQLETLLQELRAEKERASSRGGSSAGRKAEQKGGNGQGSVGQGEGDEDLEDEDEDDDDDEGPVAKRLRTETAEILTNWGSSSSSPSPSTRLAVPPISTKPRLTSKAGRRSGGSTAGDDGEAGRGEEDSLPEPGAPLLSNPLKLLAQASAGEDDEDVVTAAATPTSGSAAVARGQTGSHTTSPPPFHTAASSSAAPRRPRDRLGLYDAKPEIGPDLDPITLNLITLPAAKQLWAFFLEKLSHPLILLDRSIYTFEYTRPRSAFLLSVGLALAARLHLSSSSLRTAEIADKLDEHVLKVIIPVVLLEGKRSIHCVKAFLLLAGYNGQSIPLTQDRSFSYVTHAFSMCVELDLNCKMVSTSADPNDEELQRKLRERERTYFLAWTYFFSICLHHGRHCSLSIHDRVVAASNDWHLSKFALPEDAGLVSNLQLRKLISRNLDYYHQHVAPLMPQAGAAGGKGSSEPDEACRLLLEFHRKSINEDLDAWHAQWVLPQVAAASAAAAAAGSSSKKQGSTDSVTDTASAPLRLQSTAFYHSYATLILHSLPLRSNHAGGRSTSASPSADEVLAPFRRKADEAALSCVALFLRLPRDQLVYGHNSAYVTVGFAAVHALRAPHGTLLGAEAGGSGTASAANADVDVDDDQVLGMVKRVVETMEEAGRVTEHRKAFATGYAVFLRKLIAIHEMRRARKGGRAALAGGEHHKAGPASQKEAVSGPQQHRRDTVISRPSGAYDAMQPAAGPSSAPSSAPPVMGPANQFAAGTEQHFGTSTGQDSFDHSRMASYNGSGQGHGRGPGSGGSLTPYSSVSSHQGQGQGQGYFPQHHHHPNASARVGSPSQHFFNNSSSFNFDPSTLAPASSSSANLLDELLMAQPLGLQFDSWLDDLGGLAAGAGGGGMAGTGFGGGNGEEGGAAPNGGQAGYNGGGM
ncbi:hypothetical protein BDZ90DRAFT_280976 [Jaminaea rosea]|uniref:Zn(2)-C6 fungal-type domain-containing protein n=1 Tax=Jaminaea rosea TaxID=1569628 RepID=A0A316UL80_9BASI|nr:hypothetical protein BDZ90DRAFT_280976 [Jaminaea rosea]PWN25999.1 hypothetical protein BDZ90DRAFT_280976 [Jaminaea rosea]